MSTPQTDVKPRLRGWLHAGIFPIVLLAGAILCALAPAGRARVGAIIFVACAAMLFGTSAVYHRGRWSARCLSARASRSFARNPEEIPAWM